MATNSKKTTLKKSTVAPVKKTVAAANKKSATILAKTASAPIAAKSASKQAANSNGAANKIIGKNAVTPEERYHMIATAAYFRAQHRGFVCSCEKEDWISCEAQIDAMLNA